jgi:carboxyl-terminal processing protease
VIGGGGIRPDIVVRGDTLTTGEQEFVRELGSQLPAYRDVMTTYALELKGSNAVRDPEFRVGGRMLRQLRQRLEERDIELSDEQWAAARSLIEQQFTYEITRYVFGREAEQRRRMRDDPQLRTAVDLLKRARTSRDLFALAAEAAATRNP